MLYYNMLYYAMTYYTIDILYWCASRPQERGGALVVAAKWEVVHVLLLCIVYSHMYI